MRNVIFVSAHGGLMRLEQQSFRTAELSGTPTDSSEKDFVSARFVPRLSIRWE